jgi:hypothetical protein
MLNHCIPNKNDSRFYRDCMNPSYQVRKKLFVWIRQKCAAIDEVALTKSADGATLA